MRILFAAGGTGGHINPAIAIAKKFREELQGSEILFIGTKRGLEGKLVPREGFDIKYIETVGFKRKITFENVIVAEKALKSMFDAKKIIKNFKPDLVIGCGGYVSGPVVAEAALKKIPTLIHEQNAFPGVTNKMLAKKVDTVCISFEEAEEYFKKSKNVVYTGNPVRSSLFTVSRQAGRLSIRADDRPLIVAVGGSLGAGTINREMLKFIKNIPDDVQLLLATGSREYADISAAAGILPSNVKIEPYIYNMDEVLAAADLVVSRSGAITLTELCATGTPSILIPSPNVAENHQEINARALEARGAAVVICEREIEETTLFDKITELIYDSEKLQNMGRAAKEMSKPDALDLIYEQCLKLISM